MRTHLSEQKGIFLFQGVLTGPVRKTSIFGKYLNFHIARKDDRENLSEHRVCFLVYNFGQWYLYRYIFLDKQIDLIFKNRFGEALWFANTLQKSSHSSSVLITHYFLMINAEKPKFQTLLYPCKTTRPQALLTATNEGKICSIHFNWKTRQSLGKETLSFLQLMLCTGCLKLSLSSFWIPARWQVQTSLIYPVSWQTAVDQIKHQQKRSWKYCERHWASLLATSVGYSRYTCHACTACLFPAPKHLPY